MFTPMIPSLSTSLSVGSDRGEFQTRTSVKRDTQSPHSSDGLVTRA